MVNEKLQNEIGIRASSNKHEASKEQIFSAHQE